MISRQRHFKMWHDHATIGGYGHFLVLVAPIFDPVFYYISDEVLSLYGADIDVPSIIEQPEVHILARSLSSAGDQAMFNETRRKCILDLSTELRTKNGYALNDCLHFFHADGLAAQFEAGNKISRVDISAASNVALILMIFHIAIMHIHAPLLNVKSLYKVKPGRGQLEC